MKTRVAKRRNVGGDIIKEKQEREKATKETENIPEEGVGKEEES